MLVVGRQEPMAHVGRLVVEVERKLVDTLVVWTVDRLVVVDS